MKPEDIDPVLEEKLKWAYLEIGDVTKIQTRNPFNDAKFNNQTDFIENLIDFMRKPENFWFTCKYLLNIDLLPVQQATLQKLWDKPQVMLIGTRGGAKSFILTVYIILRAIFDQGSKIVIVGAAFRQSLILFESLQVIWANASILQDICGGKKGAPKKEIHMASWACGSSTIKFLPMGTSGETIRGQRATLLVADEFSSINPDVYELVVKGFAIVKSKGLVESVQYAYRNQLLEEMGLSNELGHVDSRLKTNGSLGCNQVIIAGTASFQFNHFYKYYRLYKSIIQSKGDSKTFKESNPDMFIDPDLDYRDYCIIRLPYDLMPMGMMDRGILAQAKAIMNSSLFDQEYSCIFPTDSDGFYPASIIHGCVCPVKDLEGNMVDHKGLLYSGLDKKYVMGIDPASEKDNFAINIIERGFPRRIVYQWTTSRKKFQKKKEKGEIDGDVEDYHSYCIKHIRKLIRRFNIELIVCDAGGGGLSVREGLLDKDKMKDGECPIYDIDDEMVQGLPGSHILKMINFQDSNWRKEAHYGLKKDFEDKRIAIPKFDNVLLAEATYLEMKDESLEDVYLEIEEMKRETMLVKHEVTNSSQQERWIVPELKITGADEISEKLKKDRFTSLLLSNYGCRFLDSVERNQYSYTSIGSIVGFKKNVESNQPFYTGTGARKMKVLDPKKYMGGFMIDRGE